MKHSLLPVLLALMLISCSQSSNTSLNNSGFEMWTIPAAGTQYVFQSTSLGLKTVIDTTRILTTGQHLGGKTNVIDYEENNSGTVGTAFYNIESNGDVSDGYSTINALGDTTYIWTTFPTGSQQPISDPVVDTTESGIHIFSSDVRTYIGAETLSTTGGLFSTLHVRETSIRIVTGPDSLNCNASDTSLLDRWYAPAIAIYVKVTSSGTEDGVASDSSETDLIKYLPK